MSARLNMVRSTGSLLGLMFPQIHSTDTTSLIVIPQSKLNHSGRYIINAESPAGHKVVKVRVTVLGKSHLSAAA